MLFPLKFWPDFPILFPGFLGSQCIFWVELSLLLVCFRLWYTKKGLCDNLCFQEFDVWKCLSS